MATHGPESASSADPPADPAPPSETWQGLLVALGVHACGIGLFAVAVWIMVLMSWMRVLSGKGIILALLLGLIGPFVYVCSYLVFVVLTILAFGRGHYLPAVILLLMTLAAFTEGYFVWQYFQAHGSKGLVALFGGSGLKF